MKVLSQADAPVSSALEVRSFAFGDLTLAFESDDRAWMSYLAERYPRFALDEAPAPAAFRVRFEPMGATPADLVSPLEARLENVTIQTTASGFELSTPSSRTMVDLDVRLATLRGPSAMYPLDNLLRHLLPVLWSDGALFHGAGLAEGGRGVLACGPSGAGKSTLAKLADRQALCDELAGVRREETSARDHRLVSLPFWAARPGRARLAALVLLEHGENHRLTELSPGEALRALSTLLLWPTAWAPAMAETLAHFTHLVESVPAYRLSFAPRDDVWPFLAKEVL